MHTPSRMTFGPFEIHAESRELFKNGVRVRLPGQPFEILFILLRNSGEVVTREQLREQVWSDGTFVDFEHGLYSAMNKLRRVLGDSADRPRYIETVSGLGYRFIGRLQQPASPVSAEALGPHVVPQSQSRWSQAWVLGVAGCLLSLVALWWYYPNSGSSSPRKLIQLTRDVGLSNDPALSRDGTLIAYSSDRARSGEPDLYVAHVAGGQPLRLTFDGAGNTSPNFSPDGSKIIFRSNRDGGGIYDVAALGGEARMLTHDGQAPKVSPDGSQVAYWIGDANVASTVPGSGTVWVIPSSGGEPQRIGANFTAAREPIWSPDSKHLLVVGYTSSKLYDDTAIDWWLVSTDRAAATRTGAYEALIRAGLQERASGANNLQSSSIPIPGVPIPSCWSVDGKSVIFSAGNGDARNLWEAGLSFQTGKVTGNFRRLTMGSGDEIEPSCVSGSLAFTKLEVRREVWSFGNPSNAANNELVPLTEGRAVREYPSLSADARYMAFASSQSGRLNIWRRDLINGQESLVAGSPFVQRFPVSSRSGNRIAYSSYENGARLVYVSAPGSPPERLCGGCLRATDWSADEKTVLTFGGSPYQVNAVDVASRRTTSVLRHPSYHLLYGRFSPDNVWISFTARIAANRSSIFVAPLDGMNPIPESSWIKIGDEGVEDWASWSGDGHTLYFTSSRDGHTCLWAQRLNANTHRPAGAAVAVRHLHGLLAYQQGGWSEANGKFAFVLREDTGNIWMMPNP